MTREDDSAESSKVADDRDLERNSGSDVVQDSWFLSLWDSLHWVHIMIEEEEKRQSYREQKSYIEESEKKQ